MPGVLGGGGGGWRRRIRLFSRGTRDRILFAGACRRESGSTRRELPPAPRIPHPPRVAVGAVAPHASKTRIGCGILSVKGMVDPKDFLSDISPWINEDRLDMMSSRILVTVRADSAVGPCRGFCLHHLLTVLFLGIQPTTYKMSVANLAQGLERGFEPEW